MAAALCAKTGRGQSPPPIGGGEYNVDLYRGALIANSRVVGMAGAFTGVAEGTAGIPFNPAAVANRPYHSKSWFDWDYDIDVLVPNTAERQRFDFNNSGFANDERFLPQALGGHLMFGRVGVGLFVRNVEQPLRVDPSEGAAADELAAELLDLHLATGLSLFGDQLVTGVALKIGRFALTRLSTSQELAVTSNSAIVVGALLRPTAAPYRLGLALTAPLRAVDRSGSCSSGNCPGDIRLPSSVSLPWAVGAGASWQFPLDGQAYNPAPLDWERPWREEAPSSDLAGRYAGGRYVLISAELELSGPADDGLSIDAVPAQAHFASGERVVLKPALGVESEVIRRRLRLRGGVYREPGRVSRMPGRAHGTFGVQVRLFDFRLPLTDYHYGLSFLSGLDFARDYSNVAVSFLSLWH